MVPVCGDGILLGPDEQCDDENTNNLDGCSDQCKIESPLFTCNTPALGKSTCDGVCGDGFKVLGEDCDDHNLVSNDGCESNCKVTPGWICEGGSEKQKSNCQCGCDGCGSDKAEDMVGKSCKKCQVTIT